MKRLDILIIIVMIGAILFGSIYYYQKNVQECTSNPLVYSAKLYEKHYDVQAYGNLMLIPLDEKAMINIINIEFNSNSTTVNKNN